MPLNENYREEYYELLKGFVLLEALIRRYEALEKEYKELKAQINEKLEQAKSICSDCERLLDEETGELNENAQVIVGKDKALNESLLRLSELSAQKKQIEKESGFDDELYLKVVSVVAIGDYEKMEKRIIDELGKEQGERVIYEEKKKAAEFEKTVGVYFFGDAVERMEEWFEIKVLYPTDGEITLTKENNFLEQNLLLRNEQGLKIPFKKTAQTTYRGVIYLELISLQNRKIRGVNYYTVEQTDNGQKLVLLEDEKLYETLYDLCEIY
jgi:hypothetical protein